MFCCLVALIGNQQAASANQLRARGNWQGLSLFSLGCFRDQSQQQPCSRLCRVKSCLSQTAGAGKGRVDNVETVHGTSTLVRGNDCKHGLAPSRLDMWLNKSHYRFALVCIQLGWSSYYWSLSVTNGRPGMFSFSWPNSFPLAKLGWWRFPFST